MKSTTCLIKLKSSAKVRTIQNHSAFLELLCSPPLVLCVLSSFSLECLLFYPPSFPSPVLGTLYTAGQIDVALSCLQITENLAGKNVRQVIKTWYRICLQCGRPGFNPWVGKIPWRRTWQPTPVFLLGESQARIRNSMDRGARRATVHGVTKESDTT